MAFIGLRNSVVDACIHATSLLYKSKKGAAGVPRKVRRAQQVPPPADWRSVLEMGFIEPSTSQASTERSGTVRPGIFRHHPALPRTAMRRRA